MLSKTVDAAVYSLCCQLAKYDEKFPEATVENVQNAIGNSDVTVITFLSEQRHEEVEEVIYDVRDRWPNIAFVVVHPTDKDSKLLAATYDIRGTVKLNLSIIVLVVYLFTCVFIIQLVSCG